MAEGVAALGVRGREGGVGLAGRGAAGVRCSRRVRQPRSLPPPLTAGFSVHDYFGDSLTEL